MAKSDKTLHSEALSIEQLNAIDLLIQGKTDFVVGEAVGVARQTVCNWRNQNAAFIAELNTRRKDIWQSQEDKLRSLVAEAVDVLADELRCEDAKARSDAAKFLIRASGFYGQSIEPVGNTDAEDIEKAWRFDSAFDFDFG